MMLEVKCCEIDNILESIKKECSKESHKLTNVYDCNGIKIDMACYVEYFGEEEKIKRELCEVEMKDSDGKFENLVFTLDEEMIKPNILNGSKATYMNLGDVLYEISKKLGKEVLITVCGEPKLYIKNSFIWRLNPEKIEKDW